MDIDFITDPEVAPRPRHEVRILGLAVTSLLSDSQRLQVEIEISPFAPGDRPSLEVTVWTEDGTLVTSASVIETMQRILAMTLHLRKSVAPSSKCIVRADLYYDAAQVQHSVSQSIVLPSHAPSPAG